MAASSQRPPAPGAGSLQALKPTVVERYWNDIAAHFREPGFSTFDKERSSMAIKDPEFMRKLLTTAISNHPGQGDLVPSVIAKCCCDLFCSLDKQGKTEFLKLLARDFGVLQEDVIRSANQYTSAAQQDPGSKALMRAEQLLRHAIVPGHSKFFDRVSRLPGGLKFLIDLRADLLNILADNRQDIYLSALNESLKEKLQAWFVGFLDLQRLTWQSPAVLLEKVTQHEAVHKFKDFQDLKRRVGPGRRMFALMNKNMPDEPLVFVHVALVETLSDNVQRILNDPNPAHVDPAETVKCAIFYSITTQIGLSGIELGNFLIKRVVRSLQVEFPQIETFSTLSPIPGFRRWIDQNIGLGKRLLLPAEEPLVQQVFKASALGSSRIESTEDQFKALLKDPALVGQTDHMMLEELRPILTRLCARYLLVEKRRHLALDPVANFHLRNGACAHRLNWLGDVSDKGLKESFGMMVNYLYALDHIEMNNQQYLQDGTITVSAADEDGGGLYTVVQESVPLLTNNNTGGASDAVGGIRREKKTVAKEIHNAGEGREASEEAWNRLAKPAQPEWEDGDEEALAGELVGLDGGVKFRLVKVVTA
ncbi:hypothetical protein DFQ27_002614 [Actinomortierella ambigua]|uniref:Malonyl-CoA decarboxylase n=1 Tax=Actinomortierella ambigua TaxID=1343610 RepID=A0A9P6UDD2_9FUNG|nr:hypothetical protein DFQ27_002614 [Actinomortierella ambigua]